MFFLRENICSTNHKLRHTHALAFHELPRLREIKVGSGITSTRHSNDSAICFEIVSWWHHAVNEDESRVWSKESPRLEKPFKSCANTSLCDWWEKKENWASTRTENEAFEDGRSEVGDGIIMLLLKEIMLQLMLTPTLSWTKETQINLHLRLLLWSDEWRRLLSARPWLAVAAHRRHACVGIRVKLTLQQTLHLLLLLSTVSPRRLCLKCENDF